MMKYYILNYLWYLFHRMSSYDDIKFDVMK